MNDYTDLIARLREIQSEESIDRAAYAQEGGDYGEPTKLEALVNDAADAIEAMVEERDVLRAENLALLDVLQTVRGLTRAFENHPASIIAQIDAALTRTGQAAARRGTPERSPPTT